MAQGVSLDDPDLDTRLSKSDTMEKIEFEASVGRGVQAVFKKEDDFVIWGPASVEVVDKEGDKISVEALSDALPQLLRRARLSLEHTDQIVGRILERFETQEPVTVEINGQQYKRQEFPTGVLDLEDDEPAALYVAGEVYNDTQQSKRARERIEDGELTSYSISGEALVTRKQVDEGTVYDDVLDLDLSAVTLCEEGMNQGAAYAKVEGELSGKDLAGEASDDDVSKREEVPVLEHPPMQGVGTAPGAEGADRSAAVNKSMSNNDSDESPEDEKSDGATIEDVLKRLPEEGQLATKEDAQKAVEDSLPDGDLATMGAVKSIVENEVEAQFKQHQLAESDVDEKSLAGLVAGSLDASQDDAQEFISRNVEPVTAGAMWDDLNSARKAAEEAGDLEEFVETFKQEYGPDMATPSVDGSSPADSESAEAGDVDQGGDPEPDAAPDNAQNTTAGSQEPSQGNEQGDLSGVETTSGKDAEKADSVRDARDKIAEEFGVEAQKVNGALNDLLAAEDDDEDEMPPEEGDEADDVPAEEIEDPDDDDEQEVDVVEEGDDEDYEDEEMDDEEPPIPEGEPEEDEEDEMEMMQILEESLPSDVFEVVEQYVEPDQIAREDAEKIREAAKAGDGGNTEAEEGDLNKTVEDILTGGAEVQGGQAIPTDTEGDDTVEKQYEGPEGDGDGGASGGSPALSNFYDN